MASATFRIWRGDKNGGKFVDYSTEVESGMVVLDVVHRIQATQAGDLAVRWNCKAGKCGSCSAEINGKPRLMCMTRLSEIAARSAGDRRADAHLPEHQRSGDRRLLELSRKRKDPEIPAAQAGRAGWDAGACSRPMSTGCRSSASASNAICARTCATCCAIITCTTSSSGRGFWCTRRTLEMNPLDTADRLGDLRDSCGIGYCNITKCCTKVCPEEIKITDNAIIPLKERVVDEFYDPLRRLFKIFG